MPTISAWDFGADEKIVKCGVVTVKAGLQGRGRNLHAAIAVRRAR